MIVTSALPCDSPAVRKRSTGPSFYPKLLRGLDLRSRDLPVILRGDYLAFHPAHSVPSPRPHAAAAFWGTGPKEPSMDAVKAVKAVKALSHESRE
jgi:hypothetical protein